MIKTHSVEAHRRRARHVPATRDGEEDSEEEEQARHCAVARPLLQKQLKKSTAETTARVLAETTNTAVYLGEEGVQASSCTYMRIFARRAQCRRTPHFQIFFAALCCRIVYIYYSGSLLERVHYYAGSL